MTRVARPPIPDPDQTLWWLFIEGAWRAASAHAAALYSTAGFPVRLASYRELLAANAAC